MEFSKEVIAAEQRESDRRAAIIKDAILLILMNEEGINEVQLHYKLLQCGIHITAPELNRLIGQIKEQGYLTMKNFKGGTSFRSATPDRNN